VQFPGSCPWVLTVGGTTVGNVNGSQFDEYVWNDPDPGDSSHWGTTGGGVSDFFNLPSYQQNTEVPASINNGRVGRGVPDVAANASLNAGYSDIFIGGVAQLGNGTSASAPLWAGLIAIINAALGHDVGFVNSYLYSLGSGSFREIIPGTGPADNSNGGVSGYPAGPGWDACTGWGSPNGTALLVGLQGINDAALRSVAATALGPHAALTSAASKSGRFSGFTAR
jgi:kumamolisin